MHLAQLNVGSLRAPMDEPRIDDFRENLDRINELFFEAASQPILRWIPEGAIPSVEDAIARLDHLRAHGPTPVAFTFSHRFGPDGTPVGRRIVRDTCPA